MQGWRLCVCALTLGLAAAQLAAQPPAAASFTVASVHAVDSPGETRVSPTDAPIFTAENVTLKILISVAYGVDSGNVLDGPRWLDSAQFSVQARHDDGIAWTTEQFQTAMQALLAERFHLRAERHNTERSGFGLVIAEGGSKLTPAQSKVPGQVWRMRGRLHAGAVDVNGLAGLVGLALQSPVVDATHLPGLYTFDLNFREDDDAASDLPSLTTALREQLGLKLVKQAVPVKQLRVLAVDPQPTAN